jgi:prepilin-type N-terminal cleavage/methylation domain-containing protein
MNTNRRRDERGFTLIEFAVAMTVFTIFMAVAGPFLFTQLTGALRTEDRVELTQNARAALRTMVRELRQAQGLLTSPPDKPLDNDELSFSVDFDGNGTITSYLNTAAPLEQVTYYVLDGALYRGRRKGQGSPLATGVDSVGFEFFGSNLALDTNPADGTITFAELDRNGNGKLDTAELANVTRVRILLTMVSGSITQTYSEEAFMRNSVSL